MCLIHLVSGAFRHQPDEITEKLSDGARRLMDRSFEDVDPSKRRDYHVHMVGLGTNNSGMSVNRKMLSWLYPLHRLRAAVYMSGASVTDRSQADQQYADRLVSLIRNIEGGSRGHILAFDHHLNEIYHCNPLLFDYVLKRTIRAPGTRERLSADVFQANTALEAAPDLARPSTH